MLQTLATRLSPRILQRARTAGRRSRASSTSTSSGDRRSFDLPLDLALSTGSAAGAAATCPRSATARPPATRQVAALAGNPKAVRAVGTACATNPLPIVVAVPPGGALRRDDGRLRRRRRRPSAPCWTWRQRHERHHAEPVGRPGRSRRLGRGHRRARRDGGALLPAAAQRRTSGRAIIALYERRPDRFRSTVNMARLPLRRGRVPLLRRTRYPEPVERLKQALYPRLLPIARDWWTQARPRRRRGRTRWTSGWRCATPPGRPSPRRSCYVRPGRLERAAPRPVRRPGVPAAGRDQPQRARASTTPAASSCSSSSGRGRSRAAPPRCSRTATGWCSPPATGRCDRPRLVGRAGPARRVRGSSGRAAHPRPGLPRRRVVMP